MTKLDKLIEGLAYAPKSCIDEAVEMLQTQARRIAELEGASKLEQIVGMCKASVHITVNDHTTSYRSVAAEFEQRASYDPDGVSPDEVNSCVSGGAIWHIQAYPDTPVGFFECSAGTMDEALDVMLKTLKDNKS